MKLSGTFEVSFEGEPPFDERDGLIMGRARVNKRFAGGLEGTSRVEMLSARTPVASSAAYVAVERIDGTLGGRAGAFVVVHRGIRSKTGGDRLEIEIVPDSGTGGLAGISGTMGIEIADGQHHYTIDFELPDAV